MESPGIATRTRVLAQVSQYIYQSVSMAGNGATGSGRPQSQLFLKETYFQNPNAVVPPNAMPKKAATPTVRSIPTTSSSRRDSKNEPLAHETMVYKAIQLKVAILDEDETPRKCVGALCRSTWRAFRKSVCPPATTELNDPESSIGRMLSSYHSFPVYGYGSISAGPKPTHVPGSVWTRAQQRSPPPPGWTDSLSNTKRQ
jgi:hypothetical protein